MRTIIDRANIRPGEYTAFLACGLGPVWSATVTKRTRGFHVQLVNLEAPELVDELPLSGLPPDVLFETDTPAPLESAKPSAWIQ